MELTQISGEDCFKTSHGVFVLGDTRKLVTQLPDESIDIIITDPPWGLNYDEYDDSEVFFEIEDELWRVLKKNAWLIFYYTPRNAPSISRFRRFKYVWTMIYTFQEGSTARNPFGVKIVYSLIVILKKGSPKIKRKRSDIIPADELPFIERKVKNPLFKPTGVTAQLLFMFTDRNETVLDPFAGYGSIPLVCDFFERSWVAFEIDPVKYRLARKLVLEKKVPRELL